MEVCRVAVIGAGALGLMAMKNLKEDGFEVTGYEARTWVGGLWKPSDDNKLSALESTVFNSSKYRTAISDYPFPDDTDDFPTAPQLHRYLEGYCDHFGLRHLIHFSTPVKSMRYEHGKWLLEVQPEGAPGSRIDTFDKVVVSIGSFVTPKVPTVEGIETFQGQIMHSIQFQDPSRFKGHNVLIVGLHATAQDITAALAGYANKVYLSHRSGLLMISKYSPSGATFDQAATLAFTLFHLWMMKWFPRLFDWLIDWVLRKMSEKSFPSIPTGWNFQPSPSVVISPPLIADEIYPHLTSGFAVPVPGIRRVTGPHSVQLSDSTDLDDISSIIYCTGYDGDVPIHSPSFRPYTYPGAVPNLYRGIFPLHPDPAIRTSLAYLGHGAVAVPGLAQHELVAMAISQVFRGTSTLPSFRQMQTWHAQRLAWRDQVLRRFLPSTATTFYPVILPVYDQLPWLDATAGTRVFEHFGGRSWWSRPAWAFWWADRDFYHRCLYGLFASGIWRLFDGRGKRRAWKGAREEILREQDRAREQVVRTRMAWMGK